MEPERWQQIKQIVNACLELEPDARERHIITVCASDATLAAEVKSMLASYAEVGDFLAEPVWDSGPGELLTGSRIGSYQLCEPIAEGGMGAVYRAVRSSDFEKQVAIKLVKRGMDTNFILRRFRHERQILAGLDHPNIARLLDGGATGDDRPYLVMEYIEGTPITEYAEQHKLDIAARLEMFRTVCTAVQFAHQNLVVHRDLKPNYILVTSDGFPKLLDFGIAKLLEPDVDTTTTSLRLMTPECASPEQVRGEPVTTATDIYSLGVLLYSLLTGESPYQFTTRTPQEIARVVCETEPLKPSAIRPLPEDLDNIVLKAMHKDPARRYVSAEQLSEDIRRYLTGLPVIARKDTFRYRASKFVRRHKAASIAATLIAISLLAGMAATLWQAHIAGSERARAERRFNDVRELANSLLFDLNDAIQPLPGSTPVRKLLVDRALKYLNRLSQEAGGDPRLQEELAVAYQRVGDVQGGVRNANLGDSTGALSSYRKSLEMFEAIAAAQYGNLDAKRHLTETLDRIGVLWMLMGNVEEALAVERKALAINGTLSKDSRSSLKDNEQLAKNYDLIGDLLGGNGATGSLNDAAGALENHRKALDVSLTLTKRSPAVAHYQDNVSVTRTKIGDDLVNLGRREEALAFYREALPWWESLSPNATEPKTRQKLATLYSRMGDALLNDGDNAGALKYYQLELSILEPLLAADPRNAWFQLGAADSYANVGSALARSGKTAAGLTSLRKATNIMRQRVANDPKNGYDRGALGHYTTWTGRACQMGGDLREALANYRTAQQLYQSVLDSDPSDVDSRLNVAAGFNSIGGVLVEQRKTEEARDSYRRALAIVEPLGTSKTGSEAARYTLADTYSGLGDAAASAGSWSEARSWYERSLAIWDRTHNPGVASPNGFFTGGPNQVRAQLAKARTHGE
jgi:serine/threonine protein kinase